MTDTATSLVQAHLASGVGHLEICRPEKKNALTSAMGEHLLRGLRSLEGDGRCHAIVISGRGGDLSSGADLDETRDPATASRSWAGDPHAQLLRAIATARVPVITAIDGWAIGLGLGAVGAGTYAVAGQGSRFALPEIRAGYLPHAVLPHVIYRTPPETVLQWATSGAVIDVDEALAHRLVTHVAGTGQALEGAYALARTFSAAPREVVEQAMSFLRECRSSGGASRVISWCDRQMDALLTAATTRSSQ